MVLTVWCLWSTVYCAHCTHSAAEEESKVLAFVHFTSKLIMYRTKSSGGIWGEIPGCHGSPLSAQVSSKNLCTKRKLRPGGTPYLTNSNKILTVAHLSVFLSEFWSTSCLKRDRLCHRRSRIGVVKAKVGVVLKFLRALCSRFL